LNSVLRKRQQFLFHMLHTSCCSFNNHGEKFWMRKELNCDYDKRNTNIILHIMDYISLSWPDTLELVLPIMMSLIENCCK
jgi:hypothetical protein